MKSKDNNNLVIDDEAYENLMKFLKASKNIEKLINERRKKNMTKSKTDK